MAIPVLCGCDLHLVAKHFLTLSTGREVLVCQACFSVNDPTFGIQEPLAPFCPIQTWSFHDDHELMRRYATGQSTEQMARYFKVGRHTVEARFRELGLPFLKKDGGRRGLYTSGELVALFGNHVSSMVMRLWILNGYFGQALPLRRRKGTPRYLTYDSVLTFFENPVHWCRWETAWITDPTIQDYAASLRGKTQWIDLKEAGKRVLFHARTVLAWIEKGVLPGIRHGKRWYVRADHIAAIQKHLDLLPAPGDKQKAGRNRDQLIARLRAIVEAQIA